MHIYVYKIWLLLMKKICSGHSEWSYVVKAKQSKVVIGFYYNVRLAGSTYDTGCCFGNIWPNFSNHVIASAHYLIEFVYNLSVKRIFDQIVILNFLGGLNRFAEFIF